ncbi:MAG: NAD(P)H-hydrate epimerase [Verrucomicrobiales bacterium]|jgi:NAD(P)H-hydrate epimerase
MGDASFPSVGADSIGWLTTEQMVEVDRIMIEELGIELMQMMENAGRNLARLAIDRYEPTNVTVCAGPGGNGGGGLVAARHLAVAGVDVHIVLTADRDRFTPVPAHQLSIIDRMKLPVADAVSASTDLILDAVIGYSLHGAPRGRAAEVIRQMTATDAPILSLDTPSGLDTSTGLAADPHINADATMTLALPKQGLRDHSAVGELFLADISVPPSVYEAMRVGPSPDFRPGPLLRIVAT